MKVKNYPLVYIEWADSFGCSSEWTSTADVADVEHICISVGFLLKESKDIVVIVPHFSPANEKIDAKEQGCGDMAIPRSAIRQLRTLKIMKKKQPIARR